jgi:predicted GNAT family acetyltransferase
MKRYKETGYAIALCAGMLAIGGCASTYYRVTDPVSGQVYYTEKVEFKKSGSATFTDV